MLTNNRLLLGVGTSPWPEDYEICGVPWERRGKRMDEEIAVMRGLMAGGFFEFHGEIFDVPVHQDVPDAEPSGADPDRRSPRGRPAPGRPSTATAGCTAAATRPTCPACWSASPQLRREHGTEDKPFEVHVISARRLQSRRRRAPRGAGRHRRHRRLPLALRAEQDTEPLQAKIDSLRRFADDVIAKVR